MIGANELSLMKPSAYLINTARMDIVDGEAVWEALSNHRIAGAAFDFGNIKAHERIFKLSNVISTPHLGNRVAETYRMVVARAIQNALDVLAGKRPDSILNPEVYDQ